MRKRLSWWWMIAIPVLLLSGCGASLAESQGGISSGMPPKTLVWVVEVHAKAIHWDHSAPLGYSGSAQADTDYSAVLNAQTGYVSDQGECSCWPLPLSKAGTVLSLSPKCSAS